MKQLKIKPSLKTFNLQNVYVYQNTISPSFNTTINNVKQISCSLIRLYIRHGGLTKVLHFLLEDRTPASH